MATRSEKHQLKRRKIRTIITRSLAAVLGIAIVLGIFAAVSTMSAVESATSAVEAAEEMLHDLADQQAIDTARQSKQYATGLVNELPQGATWEELSQRLDQIGQALAVAQAELDAEKERLRREAQVEEAVALAESLTDDLSEFEKAEEASEAYSQAMELWQQLDSGEAREELHKRLMAVLEEIEYAQELLTAQQRATEAVEEVQNLSANLSTQSRVNSARAAHDHAKDLVDKLPDGQLKEDLAGQLAEVQIKIAQAQQQIHAQAQANATSAVERAESRSASLSNWDTISAAEEAYDEAMYLVHRLPRGSVRTSLLNRLNTVGNAIDAAEAKLREKERQAVLYTYSQMITEIQSLASDYPDLVSAQVLGKSVAGKDIVALTLGTGEKNVLITGSIHGSEWVTTPVLIETIKQYIEDYDDDNYFETHSLRHILDTYSITFIPMANPDGVTLAQQGAGAFPDRREQLLTLNQPWGESFTRWKANISGVDINRNFAVHWHDQPSDRPSWSDEPNYAFYPGPGPESEPETKIVANWARNNNPVLFLDYHSYGEIIYWWYHQTGDQLERDRAIVQAVCDYTGFRMESVGTFDPMMSYAAYWGAEVLGIPSMTVEVGNRPPRFLNLNHVPDIMDQVRYLPIVAITNLPDYQPPDSD